MSSSLTFGYLYDFRNPLPWRRPASELYQEILEFITWSEQVGFEGAWLPEHHVTVDDYLSSPLTLLSAIAVRTSRLRIGTAVALAPLYHPLRFAEECALLQNLSVGRLDIGLAVGYRAKESAAFGVDFKRRGRQFDEFLAVVTQLWRNESVTLDGDFFQLHNARLTPSLEFKIPLFIGGFAGSALARAAKYGDGYFGNEEVCPQYLNKLENYGKSVEHGRIRIQALFFLVAEDPDEAWTELGPYYHYVNNCYGDWLQENNASGVDRTRLLQQQTLAEFKTSGTLQIKTPSEAIQYFKQMQQRIPVEHVMFMLPPGIAPEKYKKYAQLFADQVMPEFN